MKSIYKNTLAFTFLITSVYTLLMLFYTPKLYLEYLIALTSGILLFISYKKESKYLLIILSSITLLGYIIFNPLNSYFYINTNSIKYLFALTILFLFVILKKENILFNFHFKTYNLKSIFKTFLFITLFFISIFILLLLSHLLILKTIEFSFILDILYFYLIISLLYLLLSFTEYFNLKHNNNGLSKLSITLIITSITLLFLTYTISLVLNIIIQTYITNASRASELNLIVKRFNHISALVNSLISILIVIFTFSDVNEFYQKNKYLKLAKNVFIIKYFFMMICILIIDLNQNLLDIFIYVRINFYSRLVSIRSLSIIFLSFLSLIYLYIALTKNKSQTYLKYIIITIISRIVFSIFFALLDLNYDIVTNILYIISLAITTYFIYYLIINNTNISLKHKQIVKRSNKTS